VSDCILCSSGSLKYYLLLTTVLKYPPSEMCTEYETKANWNRCKLFIFNESKHSTVNRCNTQTELISTILFSTNPFHYSLNVKLTCENTTYRNQSQLNTKFVKNNIITTFVKLLCIHWCLENRSKWHKWQVSHINNQVKSRSILFCLSNS